MNKQQKYKKDNLNAALLKSKANIKRQAIMAAITVLSGIVLCFAMTVAWYSNILHTSDLTFKAKTWDFVFEGNIKMSDGNVMAAPGESGTIALSLANISDDKNILTTDTDVSTIGVNVNIDKSDMGLLNTRMYFYVDKTYELNGETIDRCYLSPSYGYTYTIYPGHTLMISEEYSNDYPIKWEWVYDVVGYYVKGNMNASGIIDNPEFVKPIVYNPEMAEYDSENRLVSVNNVPVKTFIEEQYLSKDGYLGNTFEWYVNASGNKTRYALVSEEENVWIYLCSKNEINDHNTMDTALAYRIDETTKEKPTYQARIILTGQKANENSDVIASTTDFVNKINGGSNLLKVQGDMTLTETLTVNSDTEVVVDLSGHTLTLDATINALDGSSLGFINGVIKTNKPEQTMMNVTSSEIYMDNLKIEGFECGLEIYDKDSSEDSHIYISQCDIKTNNSVVWLRGNGDKSARKTSLIIENSKLESVTYIPVGGNGTKDWYGTDIQIISSTLKGYYAAVFHPMAKSDMLIKDSTLSGITGVVIKGGNVVVENSVIHGTGVAQEPAHSASGFTDTGDAIYIEDTYIAKDGREIGLVVKGKNSLIKSDNAKAIRVYEGISGNIFVEVLEGKYSEDVSAHLPQDGSKQGTMLADGLYEVNDTPANLTVTE